MKIKSLSLIMLFNVFGICNAQNNTITISGRVTDFEGSPIDSCRVDVLYSNFSRAYSVWSDKDGYYSIPNVKKGKYMAIYAIRPKEYPRALKVTEKDMKLEYWAWNIIADKDLTINPRYHRLELYGTTAFKQNGGYPTMMLYTRPMSLGRMLSYGEDIYKDKGVAEKKQVDISAEPNEIEFKVYADDVPIAIRSIQPVEEYVGGRRMMAYLLYVDLPKRKPEKYCIFRIEAYNRAWGGEKGENAYFYEVPNYENNQDASH